MSRPAAFAATLVLTLGLGFAAPGRAQESTLPDMGSSAGELLSPGEEAELGAYTLYQLRRYDYVLSDPLIEDWLDGMGHRLAAASDRPRQDFTFFMMRDRDINAFATFGGYVGVNAGLVLTADNEDEVAAVLAHEISHVTQRHVLRAAEKAKKQQLPLTLAMLGAVIAAQHSGSSSPNSNRGDATTAAVVGIQALAAQLQINYTRANEAEADRIGIQTLYRSGYDVNAMADFFERMDRAMRGNAGGDQLPDFLKSHPVTSLRLSEARERADRLLKQPPAVAASRSVAINPLLPANLDLADAGRMPPPLRLFAWAQERLRVLSADTPAAGLREMQARVDAAHGHASDAQRYGLALAQMRAGYPAAAEAALQSLTRAHPDNLWIALALAQNAHVARNDALSRDRFEALLRAHPDDAVVSLTYAEVLNGIGSRESGQRSQAVLRSLLTVRADDPFFQRNFGRACELAGDLPRAGEAYAEAAYLNGRAEDALNQLNALLKRNDVDYIQRARIEARIAAITPEVLELRRQGAKPEDQSPDQG